VTRVHKTSLKSYFLLLEYNKLLESETRPIYNDTKIIILSHSYRFIGGGIVVFMKLVSGEDESKV